MKSSFVIRVSAFPFSGYFDGYGGNRFFGCLVMYPAADDGLGLSGSHE
jgi:hypothetical protein